MHGFHTSPSRSDFRIYAGDDDDDVNYDDDDDDDDADGKAMGG